MRVKRGYLTVLLNRLYDRGDSDFAIKHPASEVGELLSVELGDHGRCTVRFTTAVEEYKSAQQEVSRQYGEDVSRDLPGSDTFIKAVLASGILELANQDKITTFVDRYGDPDLMAGHPPVVAGFDTNLMPWRIDRLLGLRDPVSGVGYVNGFVLATGVRDELDWDYKCHDSAPFVDAFGEVFEEYWNQPLGAARIGRLGLLTYRSIRDIQQADEIQSDSGDDNIIAAYDTYNRDRRSDILLFSNDRNFVERARSHRILAQRVDFPNALPDETTARWQDIEQLIYMLAIVFGIIELPGVTIYGVWRGKDELDWQHERIKLDPRSPKLHSKLEGDLSIVESYDRLTSK